MLKKIEEYAKEFDIPIIEREGRDFLVNYIKTKKIKSILEIGSAIGYSAIVMAMVDADIKVDTIERDRLRYDKAVSNICEFALEDQVTIFCDDALTFNIDKLADNYDLLFIDAAKAQYRKFLEKYEPLLAKDGVIIVDNINFHGFVYGERETNNRNTKQLVGKIKRFNEWILNDESYEVKTYDIGDGIFVIKRKRD